MLILGASDVAAVFGMAEAFAAVREAAIAHFRGETVVPPRGAMGLERSDCELLVMPGVVGGEVFGLKLWYAFAEPREPLPRSSAVILLLDPVSRVEVVLDGGVITDLRTGAMTGLAAAELAPEGTRMIAVIGAGIQARTQILALVHALDSVTEVRVCARRHGPLAEFVEAMRAELATAYPQRMISVVAAADPAAACQGAGVVVAATTSATPVIDDGWLDPDVLVCGVGSHSPDTAELDPATVARAGLVVVDTYGGGLDGAGDISRVVAAGLLDRAEVLDLGALLADSADRSRPRGGVRVFKSVGFSAADVVSARLVARRAIELGLGTAIEIHLQRDR
ncbi:ornithine cyclodeaminase family protein [Dactylosporangium sp. NPDC000555]|uniref:ornithine cyclodeaminase family protein n=1 Tax=Dactylosporangium sp. NPDC000555 TaxID=3154260 RepID=UPI00332891DE